jgi:acetyl-CoA carboxylase biotin carboxyl carrier protein
VPIEPSLSSLPTGGDHRAKGEHTLNAETYMITSPLMGTFYSAPAPGEADFVKVGQRVNSNEVVCVIESMKVFTELKANQPGTVTQILVQNEDVVMKNQALIEITM